MNDVLPKIEDCVEIKLIFVNFWWFWQNSCISSRGQVKSESNNVLIVVKGFASEFQFKHGQLMKKLQEYINKLSANLLTKEINVKAKNSIIVTKDDFLSKSDFDFESLKNIFSKIDITKVILKENNGEVVKKRMFQLLLY